MAEAPPLNRIYVFGYSANDRDFPIVSLNADPRVAGYQVPKDLSACPDKRYPNHVFTGAQPISGDQRVRHVWEILPSPWVPFTRYDDDLGPVQGRRRSVKNEGQVASLTADKRTTYEAREGSAIVYTELEETWSIETDEDGNSLFPIRDRDFYDPSRGPVQERRQLFVPTGEEEGSLENVNGVITQTSYEPYNEFLSVKIVQTYKVNGPQLIGKATDNDGQLVTVTTQRKGADGYTPPNPTATRTVEVSREDAESLIERIVDTPEVFKANTFSVERPDPIPQKFRVAVPIRSSQEIVEGTAVTPTLSEGEISKSEEQRNKFIKRISSTSRDQAVLPQTLTGKTTNNERQEVTVTETLQLGNTDESPTATTTIESEALGDGNYVITKTEVPEVFGAETFRKTREDLTPQKFKAAQEDSTVEQNIAGTASPAITLATGEFAKSEQQINKFVKRVSTTSRAISEAVTLVEKVLTNEGQIGTRTLNLQTGDQSFTPSATLVDASVEALGDGRTVKSETVVPNVFAGRSVVKTRVDLTPEKFRAAQQDSTTEESVAGTINPNIVLGTGEFRKSEQQITEFVKRISLTSRDISASTDLTEFVITNQGQLATRTLRLSAEPQSISPDELLVDGSIEALGDGRTIKTEVRVPEVFAGKTIQAQQTDFIPTKFKTFESEITTEESIAGQVDPNISVSGNVFRKSEQQITEFVKRVSTTTKSVTEGASYVESVVLPDQRVATRTVSFNGGSLSEGPELVGGSIEAVGGGNTVTTSITASVFPEGRNSASKPDPIPARFNAGTTTTSDVRAGASTGTPTLGDYELEKTSQQVTSQTIRETTTTSLGVTDDEYSGQEYDPTLDMAIPYTESIGSGGGGGAQIITPVGRGQSIVKTYDKTAINEKLDSVLLSYPSRVTVSFPPILKRLEVQFDKSQQDGAYISKGNVVGSVNGGVSASESGSATASATVTPRFIVELENINASNIESTSYVFFTKNPSLENILSRTGSVALPVMKPRSYVLSASGQTKRISVSAAAAFSISRSGEPSQSLSSQGNGYGASIDDSTVTITIPPCLHGGFFINKAESQNATATISFNWSNTPISQQEQRTITATGKCNISLPATSPSQIGGRTFLIDSRIDFYQYGYYRVYAETAKI